MAQSKSWNPFYVAALPVGCAFAVTACAFVVMMLQTADPRRAEPTGVMAVLGTHGTAILAGELVLLAALTIAAICSDDFWTGRPAAHGQQATDSER